MDIKKQTLDQYNLIASIYNNIDILVYNTIPNEIVFQDFPKITEIKKNQIAEISISQPQKITYYV